MEWEIVWSDSNNKTVRERKMLEQKRYLLIKRNKTLLRKVLV
jgi:hypothetical protein